MKYYYSLLVYSLHQFFLTVLVYFALSSTQRFLVELTLISFLLMFNPVVSSQSYSILRIGRLQQTTDAVHLHDDIKSDDVIA